MVTKKEKIKKEAMEKFFKAIDLNDFTTMKQTMEEFGIDVDSLEESSGWSGLISACSLHRYDMIDYLLDMGADVNLETLGLKRNAIMTLTSNPKINWVGKPLEIAERIIENTKDLNKPDRDGWTLFSNVCLYNHVDLGKHLLRNHEIDPTISYKNNPTPLSLYFTESVDDIDEEFLELCMEKIGIYNLRNYLQKDESLSKCLASNEKKFTTWIRCEQKLNAKKRMETEFSKEPQNNSDADSESDSEKNNAFIR